MNNENIKTVASIQNKELDRVCGFLLKIFLRSFSDKIMPVHSCRKN